MNKCFKCGQEQTEGVAMSLLEGGIYICGTCVNQMYLNNLRKMKNFITE